MLAALMGSLKVAVTTLFVATPVAPAAGVVAVTVGGVVSTGAPVVNDHVLLEASTLPALSATPPAPPRTVAV